MAYITQEPEFFMERESEFPILFKNNQKLN